MTTNGFAALPAIGAWHLLGAHEGFEVTQFTRKGDRVIVSGTSLGIEENAPWNLRYTIELDSAWRTHRAIIEDPNGNRLEVTGDGAGEWTVNGKREPALDGCLDLDLEASVVTNTLPVHRLALDVGQRADAPAAYVRTQGLVVERLEQTYERLPDRDGSIVFDYVSPRFDYHDHLRFAKDGLVVDYPEIGARMNVRT